MTITENLQKILIVEDEADMCVLLEMILQKKDIAIAHVKKISAAEAYVKYMSPNLVVLDNWLPDGLGVNFIPFVKRFYPEIKIIMMSGKESTVKARALEYGADLFLLKPFSRMTLLRSVEGLLHSHYDLV